MTTEDDRKQHVLAQSLPEFLTLLDHDPMRAWQEFHLFAWKFLLSYPPPVFRDLPREIRDDLTAEIVSNCQANDFHKLRSYQNLGAPFSAWLARMAQNAAISHLRHEDVIQSSDPPSPRPLAPQPDEELHQKQLLEAVQDCMRLLGQKCRLMVMAAAEGWKPAQIAVIMGLPRETGKKVSDDLRACRKRLKQLLLRRGVGLTLGTAQRNT